MPCIRPCIQITSIFSILNFLTCSLALFPLFPLPPFFPPSLFLPSLYPFSPFSLPSLFSPSLSHPSIPSYNLFPPPLPFPFPPLSLPSAPRVQLAHGASGAGGGEGLLPGNGHQRHQGAQDRVAQDPGLVRIIENGFLPVTQSFTSR